MQPRDTHWMAPGNISRRGPDAPSRFADLTTVREESITSLIGEESGTLWAVPPSEHTAEILTSL